MTSLSRFVPRSAVVLPSMTLLLCCLSGPAMSQPTPTDTQLPGVAVDAPRQMAKPYKPAHRAAVRSTRSVATAPAAAANPAASTSDSAKLAKLAAATGSCVGGCQSSFKTSNQPWVGCSATGGVYSATCRNVGNYKSYDECKEAGRLTGWRSGETSAYCSSVALAAGWR